MLLSGVQIASAAALPEAAPIAAAFPEPIPQMGPIPRVWDLNVRYDFGSGKAQMTASTTTGAGVLPYKVVCLGEIKYNLFTHDNYVRCNPGYSFKIAAGGLERFDFKGGNVDVKNAKFQSVERRPGGANIAIMKASILDQSRNCMDGVSICGPK